MAKSSWKDEFVFIAYDLCKAGQPDLTIMKVIGVTPKIFYKYKQNRALFALALEKGRNGYNNINGFTFRDFVYQRLPPKLRRLYNIINRLDKSKNGIEKIETILQRRGILIRQQLLIHFWCTSNFSLSKALKKVNVSRDTFDRWVESDPDFGKLIDEIEWHRKNFIEESLMRLVACGDTVATIHASKTKNRDRGYGDRIDVNVSGNITHNVIYIDKLELPLDVKKQVLEAVRRAKQIESKEVKCLPVQIQQKDSIAV